jgi:putative transposase
MWMALPIASAVRADGYSEPIGLSVGDSENVATWDALFKNLEDRQPERVDFVISDNHSGLKKAAAKHFVGATWQRRQVHLLR